MQIYFHSRLCSYLPRVPILVEGTVCMYVCMHVCKYILVAIHFTVQCQSSIPENRVLLINSSDHKVKSKELLSSDIE